ncbi:hypothetical protein ACQP1W_40445 [Spirillospora sp. CA-255316]|jgi:hypothetical protein
MMDQETEFLICAAVLTGTAVAAATLPEQTISLLAGLLIDALLRWALLKRNRP